MKKLAAEFTGTFLLTFIGAGAMLQSSALGADQVGLLEVALAHALILSVGITALINVSGAHFNPAVTIALAMTGKARWPEVPTYIIAQVAGSLCGALLLVPMFPGEVIDAAKLGTPAPGAAHYDMGFIVLVEIVLTFVLVVSIWGTAVDKRAPSIGGFGIGLTVFCCILVGGPITGAGMNPARVIGPALAGGYWDLHAAYWIGPVVGAVLGSFFYKYLILDEPAE